MQFNAKKLRTPCILKGKMIKSIFSIQGSNIPTIEEQEVHCLGKTYDSTLKDDSNRKITLAQLDTWLKWWSRTNVRSRRDLIVQRVREATEEEFRVKAAGLAR